MTVKRLLEVCFIIFVLTTALFVRNGLSETYPNRPITLVYGWGAGGMLDVLSRTLSRVAEKELGQPIINDNKVGASGVIATNYVTKSNPDGYTLGVTVTAVYVVQPQVRKIPFNSLTDITDIMAFAKYNNALAVKADSPLNTYEDFVSYVKKNPGGFRYSSAGVGSLSSITIERLAMAQGTKLTHVPFKSGPEGVIACIGGHVDGVVMGAADLLPHVKAGKLKLILITTDSRWAEAPNVPTILEKGYDFYMMSYCAIYGPKGLPEPIRQKLEDTFRKGVKDPTFINMLKTFQLDGCSLSGKEYSAIWRSEYPKMGKVLNDLGLIEK